MTMAAIVNLFILVVVFILFITIAVLIHLFNLKVKACEESLNSINVLLEFHGIE